MHFFDFSIGPELAPEMALKPRYIKEKWPKKCDSFDFAIGPEICTLEGYLSS